MVFHWSLSNSKSPQVSKTLLSILADRNNAVVWVVSTRPVISKFSCPCTNPLVTVPRAPITIGITVTFTFLSLFNFQARSSYLSFFSLSFRLTLSSAGTAKSTILKGFFFLVDYHKVLLSGRDLVIRLNLKIPKEFVSLILQDRFWVVHISFVRMVKLQFFT